MKYLRVRWLHESSEDPVVLYSEIDDEGWEIRKVDEYVDGRIDLAGTGIQTGSTHIAEDRTPSIEEINSDPQFEAVEINPEDFDAAWDRAKKWFDLP